MGLSVYSAMCEGNDTTITRVESMFTSGFSGLQLVGAAADVNRDGKERVRAALESLGFRIPAKKLVVSLAPADVRKDGSQYDLPIAVSLALILTERDPVMPPDEWLFAAELGLDGTLRPVRGVVSYAIAAMSQGLKGVVVARENLREIRALSRIPMPGGRTPEAIGFENLADVLGWMFDGAEDGVATIRDVVWDQSTVGPNTATFDDMVLAPEMRLAAMVSAAGGHSVLLRGTPGSGKSMFAARLPSILPRMRHEEHLEALRIHSSLTQRVSEALLEGRPPVRAPHHQASSAAVLGNADHPGELALSHGGVLFLDELPEFRRDLLEALREPLETGEIRVARAKRKVAWKSKIIMIAACNNCPCGWFGSKQRECRCSMTRLMAYRAKLSGPVQDRIDLHVAVPEPATDAASLFVRLSERAKSSQTIQMADRVIVARQRASGRNGKWGCEFNGDIPSESLFDATGMTERDFAAAVAKSFPKGTSNRGIARALRVARTLADLDDRDGVNVEDIAQAAAWRPEVAARVRGEDVY